MPLRLIVALALALVFGNAQCNASCAAKSCDTAPPCHHQEAPAPCSHELLPTGTNPSVGFVWLYVTTIAAAAALVFDVQVPSFERLLPAGHGPSPPTSISLRI